MLPNTKFVRRPPLAPSLTGATTKSQMALGTANKKGTTQNDSSRFDNKIISIKQRKLKRELRRKIKLPAHVVNTITNKQSSTSQKKLKYMYSNQCLTHSKYKTLH